MERIIHAFIRVVKVCKNHNVEKHVCPCGWIYEHKYDFMTSLPFPSGFQEAHFSCYGRKGLKGKMLFEVFSRWTFKHYSQTCLTKLHVVASNVIISHKSSTHSCSFSFFCDCCGLHAQIFNKLKVYWYEMTDDCAGAVFEGHSGTRLQKHDVKLQKILHLNKDSHRGEPLMGKIFIKTRFFSVQAAAQMFFYNCRESYW